jgi:hypothetical protein
LNFDNLNKWLALIGNAGVILGILFLAIELQQSNRIAVATAEADIRSKYIDLGTTEIENLELLQSLLTLRSSQEELTPIQDLMIRRYTRNTSTFFMGVESAYDSNLISQPMFDSYINIATLTINGFPELAPYFLSIFEVRPEDEKDNAMAAHILSTARKALNEGQ